MNGLFAVTKKAKEKRSFPPTSPLPARWCRLEQQPFGF